MIHKSRCGLFILGLLLLATAPGCATMDYDDYEGGEFESSSEYLRDKAKPKAKAFQQLPGTVVPK